MMVLDKEADVEVNQEVVNVVNELSWEGLVISTASGALVVGGVRDICMYVVCSIHPRR